MSNKRTIALQLRVGEDLHKELIREAARRQLESGRQVPIADLAAKLLEKLLLGHEAEDENGGSDEEVKKYVK